MAAAHDHAAGLTRRTWLQAASAGAAMGLLGQAQAQSAAPYKALVCVFLFGGNDGLNTLVPTDARYGQYAGVRGPLAIPQGSLLPLEGVPYGFHPAMAPLLPMWQAGQMAAVLNVGPLVRPFKDRQDYLVEAAARSSQIPTNLFSHSDQQTLWQAADGQAVSRTGWGGRAASLLVADKSVVAIGRNAHFGTSLQGPCVALPNAGSDFRIAGIQNPDAGNIGALRRRDAFLQMYGRNAYPSELSRAFARMQNDAILISERLASTVKPLPTDLPASDPIRTAFQGITGSGSSASTNPFAGQLFQIAKLIRLGQSGGQGPQIYFVGVGDFDFHAAQLDRQTKLLGHLATALAAFHGAMQAMGLGGAVTSFTESDFGRTFKPNASGGTDHAWGNIQFVMGGAVKGKATYGSYPELTLGGPDDVGEKTWEQQGRWIPKISVEQYAATLLGWLGASEGQLNQILPRLPAFAPARLGFI